MFIPTTFLFVAWISGDILGVTTANEVESSGNVGTGRTTIKYRFDESVDKNETLKQLFVKATEAWMIGTCVEFKHTQEDTANDTVLVKDGGMCYHESDVFTQNISINDYCADIGGIAHEIGHALGLGHTHNRLDRDNYLNISEENIAKEYELLKGDYVIEEESDEVPQEERFSFPSFTEYKQQYEKINESENNFYGVPFDFGSIMLYAPSDDNPTMIPLDENYRRTMGSHIVSFTDRLAVNNHYKCEERCSSTKPDCKNGGFPDPHNCSSCVCPSGYGGQLCEERPDHHGECGKELTVTNEWKNETRHVYMRENSSDYYMCTDWIKSPNNTKIEVQILKISFGNSTAGCANTGIEIKTNENHTQTGYRFCDENDANVTLKSHSNLVPIITYSKENNSYYHVVLQYRIAQDTR